jgi:hypothetical protein
MMSASGLSMRLSRSSGPWSRGQPEGCRCPFPAPPDALPVYAGGAGAFTPAATTLLRALWELTKYPEGQAILIEAYKRFELEEEEI